MKFEANKHVSPEHLLYVSIIDLIDKINNNEDYTNDIFDLMNNLGFSISKDEYGKTITVDNLYWTFLLCYTKLSEEFIISNIDKFDWLNIIENQTLSENFMREHRDKLNWYYMFEKQIISDEIIEEFMQINDFRFQTDFQYGLSCFKQIDESFILRHINNLVVDTILANGNYFNTSLLSKETQKLLLYKLISDHINVYYPNALSKNLECCKLTPYMKEEYLKYTILS